MFRQRTGSSLCYRCGKLNRVDASVCFYCRARRPGLSGFAPLFGRARLVVIYTAAGALGFALSNLVGIRFTLGASGAVFGLLGAMVAYGRSRGGAFGVAVLRQYGQWALFMFIASFFLAGVNNWGHAGGFAGGSLTPLAFGHLERLPKQALDRLAALPAGAPPALSAPLPFSHRL